MLQDWLEKKSKLKGKGYVHIIIFQAYGASLLKSLGYW